MKDYTLRNLKAMGERGRDATDDKPPPKKIP